MTKLDLQNYVRKYIKNKPYCAGLLINPGMEQQIAPAKFFTTAAPPNLPPKGGL